MRITFVMPYAALNGGNKVIATYALRLRDLGHDVHVISAPPQKASWMSRLKRRLYGQGNTIKTIKPMQPQLAELGARHKVIDKPRAIVASDVPDGDVVVASWWRTAQDVANLPASKGRKYYLLQDYEMFVNHLPAELVSATYQLPLKKIAVSEYIRDAIMANHDVDEISVVPNAVDLEQFNVPVREKNATLCVGFLYNTHARKRVELAIEALKLARQRLPQLSVIAFGAEDPVQGRVALPDWVKFHYTPAQSDIRDIYSACDLWLFSSESEGFGLPLLEAMACRTPVLATRAGAAETLITGQNGKILDPSPEAFAKEIEAFSAMPAAKWAEFSQAAYETAHRYSWTDATLKLLEQFEITGG